MNPLDQTKAIAELDGWRHLEKAVRIKIGWKGYANAFWSDDKGFPQEKLPDYLTSRDAIIPVIEKQTALIRFQIEDCCSIFSTPPQLCEALLRAIGKWKD